MNSQASHLNQYKAGLDDCLSEDSRKRDREIWTDEVDVPQPWVPDLFEGYTPPLRKSHRKMRTHDRRRGLENNLKKMTQRTMYWDPKPTQTRFSQGPLLEFGASVLKD